MFRFCLHFVPPFRVNCPRVDREIAREIAQNYLHVTIAMNENEYEWHLTKFDTENDPNAHL